MKKRLFALSVFTALSTQANAFQLDTSEDWEIRWDNTLKYNLMFRTENINEDVAHKGTAQYLTADPDYSFDSRGDIVSNRVDLLSELDIVWRDNYGLRVSAAGWYDHAYSSDGDAPDSFASHWTNAISTDVGEWSDEVEDRHYLGGEILDAFVFANFDVGDVAANIRAGRHALFWGQSLLLTGAATSVGGMMNTVDAVKGFSVPGSEVKELFRPTAKVSTVVQWTDNLTTEAYVGFEHEPWLLPVPTSFFSPADGLTEDAELITVLPGLAMRVEGDEYSDNGEWGVNFSYYFEESGMELSAYYLNYSQKIQEAALTHWDLGQGVGLGLFDGTALEALKPLIGTVDVVRSDYGIYSIGETKWIYPENIDLIGVSVSKELWGISFGADLTLRRDVPLRMQLPGALAERWSGYPELGEPLDSLLVDALGEPIDYDRADEGNWDDYGPVGDVYSLVVNGLGLLTDNGIWEGGGYIVELTLTYADDISNDEFEWLLLGRDGGPTRVRQGNLNSHIAVNFNPTWYQVFPGTDLTLKTSVSAGIKGSGPTSYVGDEEVGAASIAAEFNVNQLWTVAARYSWFFGPADHSIASHWKDRDNLAFTIKRTF